MSSQHAAKAVLARNIDEDNAPNYDLIISYASSLPTSRLPPLHEWLKANSPTGAYIGPKPTYRLKFDWSGGEEPVEVVNRALEQCFGTRGMSGWEIWIRGDQLNLLIKDFRKEYLRLKELEDPEVGILDIWVEVLLNELKRIYGLPPPSPSSASEATTLFPTNPQQQRRSIRSPSRPLGIDDAPYPRLLTTETIGRPPGTRKCSPALKSPRAPSMSPALPPATSISSRAKSVSSTLLDTSRPAPSNGRPVRKQTKQSSTNGPSISPETTAVKQPYQRDENIAPLHPLLTRPYLNPVDHTMLVPNPTSSQRSDKSHFNVLSDGSDDEAAPSAKANREGPFQQREVSEVGKDGDWDEGDVFGIEEERNSGARQESDSADNEEDTDNARRGRVQKKGKGRAREESESDEDSEEDRPGQKESQEYKPGDGTDSDEVDDAVEEEDTPQQAKRRKPVRRGAKTATDADVSGSETAPIWVDHGPGPSRRRQTARENKQKEVGGQDSLRTSFRSAKSIATEPGTFTNLATTRSSRTAQATTAMTSKAVSKRKGEDHQPNSKSKRARVHQLTRAIPNTPEGNSSATTQPTPDTGTERGTDVETPTSQARGGIRAPIWDYFIFISVDAKGNQRQECRGCGQIVGGRGTTNFRDHQRLRCTGLVAASERGQAGIICDVPSAASQSTIEGKSGALVQPFNFRHSEWLSSVMQWIIVSGLPFTTIQNPHLQKAFFAANPAARLQSARTLARKLEDTYDIVNNKVIDLVRNITSTLHFMHDSWTDAGRKNSYFGVYVTYIDKHMEYKEVLLRLIHMRGRHTGERMGRGLFDLFNGVLDVGNIGPGTADNASNNRTCAEEFADLFAAENLAEPLDGADMVGCMCHIANIAALKYLKLEGALDASAYAYAPENIPEVRVMGEAPFWNTDLEERPNEDDAALMDDPDSDDEVEEHDRHVAALDLSEAIDEEEDEETDLGVSPVDLVHRLGVFVHSSPLRMAEFERIRALKNPDTRQGLLPLKDVITRWNSKEAAIRRVLRLRETIEVFTSRSREPKCPRFSREVFAALEIIQLSLEIFLKLTQTYSKVGAHAYRIIPDLVAAIDELRELHNHPSVSADRRASAEGAIKKLDKYLKRFLKNKWVCAAMALDPTVRKQGLRKLLMEEYDMPDQYRKTLSFIKSRVKHYREQLKDQQGDFQIVEHTKPVRERPNRFATTQYDAGQQEVAHNPDDTWACYNSDVSRFKCIHGERAIQYWKRMVQHRDMLPLVLAAQDILGVASSSASVERLFSHAGYVLGKKRGSLSARLLSKQVMLRMWEMQGLLTADDL